MTDEQLLAKIRQVRDEAERAIGVLERRLGVRTTEKARGGFFDELVDEQPFPPDEGSGL